MKILFAPMEGIAHWLYRSAQHACFDGADEYFLPFWSPRGQSLTHREQADVLPENNAGMKAVPQILSNSSEDFLWAADKLKALGYEEVNINLGCPSGTVVRKHRGAGLLAYPEELERFLDGVFEKTPVAVSLKTRLGMESPEEWPALLELFNRYPARRLILHPRSRAEQYGGSPHREWYDYTLRESKLPVCYNGDLFTAEALREFERRYPGTESVMCGRGFLYHPGLVNLYNGKTESVEALRRFHQMLYDGYRAQIGTEAFVLCKMKEVWACLGKGMGLGPKTLKAIHKSMRYPAFETAVDNTFAEFAARA